MSVSAIFVYEDGRVEPMALKHEMDVFSRAHRVRYAAGPDDPAPIQTPRTDYRLRGRMFDGRPIYCAPGYDVREAAIQGYVTIRDIERVTDTLRRDVRTFVRREYQQPIELDEWTGSVAGPHEIDELQAQRMAKVGVSLLCAIREATSKLPSPAQGDQ